MSNTQHELFRPARIQPTRPGRGLAYTAVVVLCGILLAILHLELIASAKQQGVCCFDDASFAVLSKNLAAGDGYVLTLDYGNVDHSGIPFHPALGTGPTTILVAAAGIRLVGPIDWVPGVATIAFNAALLSSLLLIFARQLGFARASLYVTVVMITSVLATLNHHEQWFAMLGEVESFLLTVVAYSLIAYGSRSTWTLLVSGVMLGLAFLAKELAVLYTLPVAALMLARFIRSDGLSIKQRVRKSLLPLGTVAVGASLPVMAFELYRLKTLGLHGWLLNWTQHVIFIRSQGLTQQAQGFTEQFASRIQLFSDRFEVGFMATVVLAVAGVLSALFLSRDSRAKHYAVLVGGAWALHSCYWLFMSVGWPRYAFSTIPLAMAAAAVAILHAPRRGLLAAQWGVVAFLVAAMVQPARHYTVDVLEPALSVAMAADEPSVDPKHELRDYLLHHNGVIYAPWWAHVASMEYLLPGKARFTAVTSSSTTEGLLLVDRKLSLPDTDDFRRLQLRCKPLRSFGDRYELQECAAAK